MLNQKNEVETTTEETLSPELTELGNVDIMSLLQYINQASPLLATPTPATPGLSTSPAFSELDDFDTPVIAEDDYLSGEYGGEALFPPMPEYADSSVTSPTINYGLEHFAAPVEKKLPSAQPTLSPLEQMLYSFTPETPMLHDFGDSVNPAALVRSPALPVGPSAFPSPAQPASPSMAPPMNRRKSSATGTRKGLTPEALVPIDAPTQIRKYLTPSATSRKDLPATFARKRARSTAFGDEDEEHLEPLGPNATELEQIEYKRRQNTIAARRSRARKLQHQQELESRIENLSQDKDIWKERAMMCQQMLIAHGIPAPTFED